MRHRKSGRHLNRTSAHRKAMFRNMAASLVEHEMIRTTVPKAKELRRVVEPLITMAKQDHHSRRRLAFNRVRSRAAVTKLFNELGPRYRDRPGGYVRILRHGFRAGDAAPDGGGRAGRSSGPGRGGGVGSAPRGIGRLVMRGCGSNGPSRRAPAGATAERSPRWPRPQQAVG